MIYSFANRPGVKDDILVAVDYYKNISHELAQLFLKRIQEAKNSIALSPEGFQIRYKTFVLKCWNNFHITFTILLITKNIKSLF
jgi:hypothetical protein